MIRKREERAIDIVGAIAPVLGILPNAVFESLASSILASDVQASNVPFYAGETFLAGAKLLRQYAVGPLPGVAMMMVLISRSGYCTITARYDRVRHRQRAVRAMPARRLRRGAGARW
jgi:diacylglycerol O-acyltransferase